MNCNIKIPDKANYIIETITNAGFEAYVVGKTVLENIVSNLRVFSHRGNSPFLFLSLPLQHYSTSDLGL